MDTTVSRESDPDRFEIAVDGDVAGFAQFVDHEGHRIFFHTEVGEHYAGRGVASTLVAQALEATRREGMRIVAVCPYVKKYVNTHEDWASSVDKATPAMLAAIPRRH
jgi:hypothetical protein